MSSNVGLTTPRGSGTSGYVQANRSLLKHRQYRAEPYSREVPVKHKHREPDPDILEHDRLREIEVQVHNLRDQLEDQGKDEEEIERQTDELRCKLRKQNERKTNKDEKAQERAKFKGYEVHEMAKQKLEDDERVRKAFGISKDYEEGSHWKRQAERREELALKREQQDIEEEKQRVLAKKEEENKANAAAAQRYSDGEDENSDSDVDGIDKLDKDKHRINYDSERETKSRPRTTGDVSDEETMRRRRSVSSYSDGSDED